MLGLEKSMPKTLDSGRGSHPWSLVTNPFIVGSRLLVYAPFRSTCMRACVLLTYNLKPVSAASLLPRGHDYQLSALAV